MKTVSRARMEKRRMPAPDKTHTVPFDGGLNLLASDLDIKSGELIGAMNYEIAPAGGYEQVAGYEGYDGANATDVDYYVLPIGGVQGVDNPQVGDVVVGASSGKSGTVIAVRERYAERINYIERGEDLSYFGSWTDSNCTVGSTDYPVTDPDSGMSVNTQKATFTGSASTGGVIITHTGDDIPFPADEGSAHIEFFCALDSSTMSYPVGISVTLPDQSSGSTETFTGVGCPDGIAHAIIPLEEEGVELVSGMHSWWCTVQETDGIKKVFLSTGEKDGTPSRDARLRFELYINHTTLGWIPATTAYSGDATVQMGGVSYVTSPVDDFIYQVGHSNSVGDVASSWTDAPTTYTADLILYPENGAGDWTVNEDVSVGSHVTAEVKGVSRINGESDATLDAQYKALAFDAANAAVTAVGGGSCSGPVRGVWIYNGTKYAFRDNAAGTAGTMWKATVTGWQQVVMNDLLYFDNGNYQEILQEGTVVTGSASGAATIERVVLTSGTFAQGNAEGYFVLSNVTGNYVNNEWVEIGSTQIAQATGANAAHTLEAGGKYEFRNHNFAGHVSTFRMYGVSGVDYGFEFDDVGSGNGTVFCPIWTGMDNVSTPSHFSLGDKPTHLAVHEDQLFFAFEGGSLQHSSIGAPLEWKVVTGANELAVGDEITGMVEEMADNLFVITRNRIRVLQGQNVSNYQLKDYASEHGAREWSVQRIGGGIYFDDFGFGTLQSTDKFGNYEDNAISSKIQPLIEELLELDVQASMTFRRKNLYRCFFSDKRFISVGFRDRKVAGFMVGQLNHLVTCCVSEEDTSVGTERLFFGSDDGFVYEMESGTSFDGEAINYSLRFPFWYHGGSNRMKKYTNLRLEGRLKGSASLDVNAEYDNSDADYNHDEVVSLSSGMGGGTWDFMTWDQFNWDQPTRRFPQVKLEGEGLNISLHLYGSTTANAPHTIRGATLSYRPRNIDRRAG